MNGIDHHRTELRALTGLRILAAVWVVVFHFHFTALPSVAAVSDVLGPLAGQGALGVDLFFVLSGFVIAYTHLDRLGSRWRPGGAARFVWARAGRMWPGYLLVLHLFGIWLLLRATFGSDPDIAFQAVQPDLGWGSWLRQLVLVQMWDRPFLDGASWVGPTWSISAEWLAYLLFPLTALAYFRLRRLPAAVLGIGALVAMSPMAASFLLVGSPYYPFSWLVRVLCGFSAGVLTLLAVRRLGLGGDGPSERVRRAASVTAPVAGVAIVAGLLAGDAAGGGPIGFVTLLFPVLVGALALADRGPARWLASAPMVHGGRISYALYLVHIPMFEVFWLALRHGTRGGFDGLLAPDSVSAHVIGLVVLVSTAGVAHLLYTLVEQPARRWMRDLPDVLRRSRTLPAPVVPASAVPVQDRAARTVAIPRPTPGVPVPAAAVPVVAAVPVADGRGAPVASGAPVGVAAASGVPVDTARARIDPPTLRVPGPSRPTALLPRQTGAAPAGPAAPAVPRQDTPRPARRSRTARDAGHGDDHHGDGLAGNLLAAAHLRAVTGPGRDRSAPAGADLATVSGLAMLHPSTPVPTGSAHDGDPLAVPDGRTEVDPAPAGRTPDGPTPGDGPVPGGGRTSGGDSASDDVTTAGGGSVPGGGSMPDCSGPAVPEARGARPSGSRSGVERCGRSRHSAHGSAATPIVAAAAAATRGRRRPTHGARHRAG